MIRALRLTILAALISGLLPLLSAPGLAASAATPSWLRTPAGACPMAPQAIPELGCSAATATPAAPSGPPSCLIAAGVNDACPAFLDIFDHTNPSLTRSTEDLGARIRLSPTGERAYVTGHLWDASTGEDMLTVAYTRDGHRAWTARWDDPAHKADAAYDLAVSPDGSRVYVTGQRCDGTCSVETIAYNAADGSETWTAHYADAGGGTDLACCIAVSPDGRRVFVSGGQQPESNNPNLDYNHQNQAYFLTVAYDATSGSQLWTATHTGPLRADGQNLSQSRGVVVSPDSSSVYVGGYSSGAANPDVDTVIAYDATSGNQRWLSNFSGDLIDAIRAIAITPDGAHVVTTALQRHLEHIPCPSVQECVHDGWRTTSWNTSDGSVAANLLEDGLGEVMTLAMSPRGGAVAVTGYDFENYGLVTQMTTIAYDPATGAKLWQARSTSPGEQGIPLDVEWSPDGSSVVPAGLGYRGEGGAAVAAARFYVLGGKDGQQLGTATYLGESPGDAAVLTSVAVAGPLAMVGTGYNVHSSNNNDPTLVDTDLVAVGYDFSPAPVVPEGWPLALLGTGGVIAVFKLSERRRRAQATQPST